MIMQKQQSKNAFSLLEVVIVVAIIAILAAIGIPRMSRGSRGAADSALKANLAVLRNAIDLYAAEHQGSYPTAANIEAQLTDSSNSAGATGGNSTIADSNGIGVGWIYSASSGSIIANASEKDDEGYAYNDPNVY